MPSLDLGEGGGEDTLSGIVNYLQDGGDVTRLFTSSIVGLVLSPVVAGIDIINAITTFFTTPFIETAEAGANLSGAFFDAPSNLIVAGFEITEQALATFLGETLAGIFAGPVAVGMVLLSLYMVFQFLELPSTGDTLPAIPVDIPFLGVEEEDEQQ